MPLHGVSGARSQRAQGVARLLHDQATGGSYQPRHLLVEDVLGLRLGQGVPVGYGLDGRLLPGSGPACGRDPRRLLGLADLSRAAFDRGGMRTSAFRPTPCESRWGKAVMGLDEYDATSLGHRAPDALLQSLEAV